jgi:hypothetical protein
MQYNVLLISMPPVWEPLKSRGGVLSEALLNRILELSSHATPRRWTHHVI